MYKIGAAGHPCLAECDIAKNFDMKPFVFIQVTKGLFIGRLRGK
jgi:hypothetical protein